MAKVPLVVGVDGTFDSAGHAKMWLVSDNNYYPESVAPLCFRDCSVPSKLYQQRPDIIARLECEYLKVADRVAKRGFKSMWMDVEFFVDYDPEDLNSEFSIYLMKVNGRMFAQLTDIYRKVMIFSLT